MYNKIIKNYLKKLKITDISTFLDKENIYIDNKDINIIYNYIINNIDKIITIDNNLLLKEIKSMISNNSYNKVLVLYNKYQDKIDSIKK